MHRAVLELFSREAAMKINIFDTYTYTMESIIQAQRKGLSIFERTNPR